MLDDGQPKAGQARQLARQRCCIDSVSEKTERREDRSRIEEKSASLVHIC